LDALPRATVKVVNVILEKHSMLTMDAILVCALQMVPRKMQAAQKLLALKSPMIIK
jgi:hypothetical protein